MTEWISTKDQQPDKYQRVLVCGADRYYMPQIAVYSPDTEEGFDFWDIDKDPLHVTHWMPLPEPPEL